MRISNAIARPHAAARPEDGRRMRGMIPKGWKTYVCSYNTDESSRSVLKIMKTFGRLPRRIIFCTQYGGAHELPGWSFLMSKWTTKQDYS
jgi:hypothetical protein